jgi:hypothetical protein
MDAITPEFRLDAIRPWNFPWWRDWIIDDPPATMMYKPTNAVFAIYLDPNADPANASIYQYRVRLVHVCDGFPVPANLAELAGDAIHAFGRMSDRIPPVEFRIWLPPQPQRG